MISGRERFKKNKGFINLLVKLARIFPKGLLLFIWNCNTNHSQVLFVGIRFIILKALIRDCGDNIRIGTNVQLLGWEKLEIGNNVSIHSNCYIDASGGLAIGNDVSIAHNSTILTTNHGWENESLPIKYNEVSYSPVQLKDDIWIGCGCRILAGTIINTRSIVAAGAVVNKDVQSRTIVGGIPAKVIKNF